MLVCFPVLLSHCKHRTHKAVSLKWVHWGILGICCFWSTEAVRLNFPTHTVLKKSERIEKGWLEPTKTVKLKSYYILNSLMSTIQPNVSISPFKKIIDTWVWISVALSFVLSTENWNVSALDCTIHNRIRCMSKASVTQYLVLILNNSYHRIAEYLKLEGTYTVQYCSSQGCVIIGWNSVIIPGHVSGVSL